MTLLNVIEIIKVELMRLLHPLDQIKSRSINTLDILLILATFFFFIVIFEGHIPIIHSLWDSCCVPSIEISAINFQSEYLFTMNGLPETTSTTLSTFLIFVTINYLVNKNL